MGKSWNDDAVRYLVDWLVCPRCDGDLDAAQWCSTCGADLAGPVGAELVAASTQAAEALQTRGNIIDRVPTAWPAASSAVPTPAIRTATPVAPAAGAAGGAGAVAVIAAAPNAPAAAKQISVQSVLAVAGAGLLAVAALVFTFLNPDLTSFGMRTAIISLMSVLFLGGAWFFAAKGLQFSAEAVGALGAVFVTLDIWAFAQTAPLGVSEFLFAGIGTLLGSAILLFLGVRARVRSWVWVSVVGAALTPGFWGIAGGTTWSALVGSLAVAASVLALQVIIRRLSPRFGRILAGERATATILQIAAVVIALVQLIALGLPLGSAGVFGAAGILACLSVVAALGSRDGLPRLWSVTAGAFGVTAIGILPLGVDLADSEWYTALVPILAGLALVAAATLRAAIPSRRTAFLIGAWSIALIAAFPVIILAMLQPLSTIRPLLARALDFDPSRYDVFSATFSPSSALVLVFGVAGVAATQWWTSRAVETVVSAHLARSLALGLAVLTALTVTVWPGFDTPVQAVVGLGLAASLALALTRVGRVARATPAIRRPLLIGAHLLLVLGAAIGWLQDSTVVWVGAAAVVGLAVIAQASSARWRALYFGIGYAYALIVFGTALTLANVEAVAVLCLTTTLASLFALGATLTRWLSPRSWYATLLVTAVPFVIGIVAVLLVRSGWTALSTGVTFALALTLMTTRRAGMTPLLRSAAAALLVPSLAVVVVCLGAQLLPMSGSPIVLPVVAAIVACTLPTAALIGEALRRRGISVAEADAARRWIEISALVTAVLTVLLALVRTAAGLNTTFLVLVILGVGAAASAFTTRPRYAWWAAGASWTGALWCVWAMQDVGIIEPYLLPPALAAMIVGAIFVARGRDGFALFATGLGVAVVPSLVVLAVAPASSELTFPWRTYTLLAAATLLIGLGALLKRGVLSPRFEVLRTPTLVVATCAAGAGTVQAVRWGLGLDQLALTHDALVMVPVLALSAVAAILAAVAAWVLGGGSAEAGARVPSRWTYAAASAFLVLGPITAIRFHPLSILTLMLLTLALLGFMLVIAARARSRAVSLPPVWFVFALAWCTAVAGWSQRELRVEAFSLPLGLALLGAGIVALRGLPTVAQLPGSGTPPAAAAGGTVTSWPIGFAGSWRLLAPGIIVTFLPSVLATGTDPQTWRAILVMSLALAAILIGAVKRLAAPFILGLGVLPIEILVVFMVHIGQTINPLLWWITLATAGAVLLIIAITAERKGADGTAVAARMRDLS
ncbi:hypothetical protein GCM10022381_03810 [Leifsonia kafniensis]|uniref:Zinc ribbon domain-containing protein n=1 Tax=Leifsonia kafniensis TaxID=475957 RepID=A0ABP7K395_9MICO